jgi:hypothetical protein
MEIFEKSRQDNQYRNMVDDPVLNTWAFRKNRNFCACGLAATGDELQPDAPEDQAAKDTDTEPVKNKVMNLQAWTYIRTGLVLIGLFVVGKYVYTKFIK